MTHAATSGAPLWTAAAVAIGVSLAAQDGRTHADELPRAKERETLVVPRVVGDGFPHDASFAVVSTGYLRKKDGHLSSPVVEARLSYSDDSLYVALVSEEPEPPNATFFLTFDNGRKVTVVEVGADGSVRGPSIRPFADLVSAPDDTADKDSELTSSVLVPLAELGLVGASGERIGFSVRRCLTESATDCASFGDNGTGSPTGRLVLGDAPPPP